MKKILSYLFVFSMVVLIAGTLNSTTTAVENLSVCHKNGPHWSYLDTPDVSARDGHLGHGDFLYEGGDIEDEDGWCAGNAPTDEPEVGTLTIVKVIEGETDDTFVDFSFQINDGIETPFEEDGSNEVELELDHGPFTVEEVDDLGFEVSYHGCEDIELTEDGATCTITNTVVEDNDEHEEEIENTCVLPTTLDGPKIDSYGLSLDGPENSLQNILDTNSYGIDAETDETGYQAWIVPDGTANVTFTATFIAAIADHNNHFGYYTNGDIDTFVLVDYDVPTIVNTTGVTKIGFALKSVDDEEVPVTRYFATELAENPGNDDHAVVFNPSDDTYVIAFEDVTPLGSSDEDYNDLIVEVIIEGCTEIPDEPKNECTPGEELVANGSFEDPEVTNVANWDIFTSVLGWSFDWMNPSEETPSLELHRGVSGWLSDEGQQHTELDGDFLGPVNPGQGGSTNLWQDIPTVPGENYELKFSFSGRPNTADEENILGVLLDNLDITNSPFSKSNNTGQTDWEQYTHQFTATGATTKIQFQDRGTENALGTFLDNVSVMCLEDCVETSGSIVSDDTVNDGDGNASELSFIHSGWTAVIPGATWIWATDPVEAPTNDGDLTKVFTKTFTIVGTPSTGTLNIATDNSYSVKVNGSSVPVVFDQNNFQLATQDSYDVSSLLVNGLNTLEITVTNLESPEQDAHPENNPAGLLFNLAWTAEDCGDNPPTGEPVADLELEKLVDDTTVDNGQTITYTVNVTNHGPNIATNVEVADVLPVELAYVSDDSGGGYDSNTGIWTIGTLGVDDTVTLNITVTVEATSGTITNEATVDLDPNIDIFSENNSDSIDVTINENNGGGGGGPFTLTVEITGDGQGTVLGEGIDCTSVPSEEGQEESVNDCEETYSAGTVVDLTATPNDGSNFDNSWTVSAGTCTGNTASCQVTMNGNINLTAHFGLNAIITTITSGGGGGGGGSGSSGSRSQNVTPLVLGATDAPGEVLGATIGLPNTGRAQEASSLGLIILAFLTLASYNFISVREIKLKEIK